MASANHRLNEELEAPYILSQADIEVQNALRRKIDVGKQEQKHYNLQLRLLQQELRSTDRIYDLRFQQLQKIGFMLRNETYVRRLLERKFYKTANFLNLKEMARMEGGGDDPLDDPYGADSEPTVSDPTAEKRTTKATLTGIMYEKQNTTNWW